MEMSFSELRSKVVVNLVDGRKLGHIIDIIFEAHNAKILGIIVPCSKSIMGIFKPKEDIFIPYHSICKIGEDTVLVNLTPNVPPPPKNVPYYQNPNFEYLTNAQNEK